MSSYTFWLKGPTGTHWVCVIFVLFIVFVYFSLLSLFTLSIHVFSRTNECNDTVNCTDTPVLVLTRKTSSILSSKNPVLPSSPSYVSCGRVASWSQIHFKHDNHWMNNNLPILTHNGCFSSRLQILWKTDNLKDLTLATQETPNDCLLAVQQSKSNIASLCLSYQPLCPTEVKPRSARSGEAPLYILRWNQLHLFDSC